MARILLHTLVFSPDGVSTSQLLSELMEDLQGKGHTITVLTTRPHYNRDPDAEAKQPLQQRFFGLYSVSAYQGMRVIHTWMPRKGQGTQGRLRDYFVFHLISLVLGTFIIGRQDVVLVPSPPLSIGVIGWLLAWLKGGKFVYNIQELYPALTVQMGLTTTDSLIYKLMARMERFVYARAHKISLITDYFRQHVVSLGFPAEKVVLIPNFVDTHFITPQAKDNALSRAHNLVDKFVVQYAGNIGMTQSFDTIIQAAERLQDEPNIHFLIVGNGARRDYLQQQIQERNLVNVLLLDYQPRSQVPLIYASADLSLVPLMVGTALTTIPSKIFTIMASGRAALVAVDYESELVSIVQEAECGLVVPPDDADAMEAAIRQAHAAPQQVQQYGKNGRRYVESRFSRRAISAQYDRLIRDLSHEAIAEAQTDHD
jgi:colanic acid biosynthesis glycosyl transferase WcaI